MLAYKIDIALSFNENDAIQLLALEANGLQSLNPY
jgi:hypothetical protein